MMLDSRSSIFSAKRCINLPMNILPKKPVYWTFRNKNISIFKWLSDCSAGKFLGSEGQNGRLSFRTDFTRYIYTTTDMLVIFGKSVCSKSEGQAEMTFLWTNKASNSKTRGRPVRISFLTIFPCQVLNRLTKKCCSTLSPIESTSWLIQRKSCAVVPQPKVITCYSQSMKISIVNSCRLQKFVASVYGTEKNEEILPQNYHWICWVVRSVWERSYLQSVSDVMSVMVNQQCGSKDFESVQPGIIGSNRTVFY